MSKRTIGSILIALGLIVFIVSLAADSLGIGGAPGIGWKQLTGAGLGLIVAVIGVWLLRSKKS